MKKAILVGLLLVFAWTSVVGAQGKSGLSPAEFMVLTEKLPILSALQIWNSASAFEGVTLGVTGHDWVQWSVAEKSNWLSGFFSGLDLISLYTTALLDRLGVPWEWISNTVQMQFRIGAYLFEVEALYTDPANRDIYVAGAVYIARERLNGRDVDLAAWRNKGKEQEGT